MASASRSEDRPTGFLAGSIALRVLTHRICVFLALLLVGSLAGRTSFAQGQVLLIENPSSENLNRLFSTTVLFEEGVFRPEEANAFALEVRGTVHPCFWFPFGQVHRDGSVWFARCDVRLTVRPGRTIARVVRAAEIEPPTFREHPRAATGLESLRMRLSFRADRGRSGELDLLDAGLHLEEPFLEGGLRVARSEGYAGDLHVRIWHSYPSGGLGRLFEVHLANDRTGNVPGELQGSVQLHVSGGDVAFRNEVTLGMRRLDVSEGVASWELPIRNLAVAQAWGFAFHVSHVSMEQARASAAIPLCGIMERDSWFAAKMPEVPLPQTGAGFRQKLARDMASVYQKYMTGPRDAWDPLGGDLNPPGSGDKDQFGWFPWSVRFVLELGDARALLHLEAKERRVVAARGGWFWDPVARSQIAFVDVGKDRKRSFYYWYDYIHRTSINRWGTEWIKERGDVHGWVGQDAEHYGMRPAFWNALLTGQRAQRDLFLDRVMMARCYAHSLPIDRGGYFGGGIDCARTEGRWALVLWQGGLLSADPAIWEHLGQRIERVHREWMLEPYVHEGKPAPFGSLDVRIRADSQFPGKPPVRIAWQEGFMALPYAHFDALFDSAPARAIVVRLTKDLLWNAWILPGDPDAERQATFKKMYSATDPEVYVLQDGKSLTHPWHDGLVVWPYVMIRLFEPYRDQFDERDVERWKRVRDQYDRAYGNLAEGKWYPGRMLNL